VRINEPRPSAFEYPFPPAFHLGKGIIASLPFPPSKVRFSRTPFCFAFFRRCGAWAFLGNPFPSNMEFFVVPFIRCARRPRFVPAACAAPSHLFVSPFSYDACPMRCQYRSPPLPSPPPFVLIAEFFLHRFRFGSWSLPPGPSVTESYRRSPLRSFHSPRKMTRTLIDARKGGQRRLFVSFPSSIPTPVK